ncbi:MAG: LptF/LptG family permease [Candidatus Marinimicrobia bacterium]|nr:LptF/LptG family permease [Candidatus Neomarinimicrobiota bacterium]
MDKYILTLFSSKAVMALLGFIIIFLLVDIFDHLDHIMDSTMPRIAIIQYYYHSVPWYASIGLPMSLLLATVFTMGILQKNHELSALKASGISVNRLSIPLLLIGILSSIFSFYFDNLFVTDHMEKRYELGSKYNLVSSRSNKIKKKDIFRQESQDKVLGIQRYNFRNQTAHGISIQNFQFGELASRLDAPIMRWNTENENWLLQQYYTRDWDEDSLHFQESKQDTVLQLNFTPTDLTQSTVKPEEMNYWELKQFVEKLEYYGVKDPRWAVNMHFKTAFACTSFLMMLFGISLSIRKPRSSLAVGIGVSVFVIFLYYVGIKTGQSLGYKGTLPPLWSVWLPNFIFFCIGAIMFKRTRT